MKHHEDLLVEGYRSGTWCGGFPHISESLRREFGQRIGTVTWQSIAAEWSALPELAGLGNSLSGCGLARWPGTDNRPFNNLTVKRKFNTKFTATPKAVLMLLDQISKDLPKRKREAMQVTFSATQNRVVVIGNGVIAGLSTEVSGRGQFESIGKNY